jgi:superfamily II DNA or RNA helicase/HKD family nuclease
MSNFITNQKDHKTVAGRLRALVEHSAELKFLVGFFYFSGWGELYESLKGRDDLSIKLLVGLEVDELLGKAIEHGNGRADSTGEETVDAFFASLKVALNNEQMDTKEFYRQVTFFLELIEAGRLEVKKTLEPNHAKLYLFKIKAALAGLNAARFITGSSNLTRAGLRGQDEFNVEIADYGTVEAEDYFDKLWATALPITADDGRRKRLIEFVRNNSQAAEVTPFEAYALMLKTFVELQTLKQVKPQLTRLLERNGYKRYTYQLDAVSQALTILDTYNGVIVADVVGLGKSVIASMIAKSLGGRGLVICSPGLMGDEKVDTGGWNKYLRAFELNYDWKVHSLGKLEDTLEFLHSPGGDDIKTVIVDEAHRFRNQDTAAYEQLSHICRGKKVILLTGTPFNNSPADIFSMLKLFMVPGQSGITLDENFEDRFAFYNVLFRDLSFISRYHDDADKGKETRKLYVKHFDDKPIDLAKVKAKSHELAAEIRAMLEPVLIRRNRIDLKNDHLYRTEVTEIPETRDPQELFFELDPGQADFYQRVIDNYFGEGGEFKGAIYQPFNYEGRPSGSKEEDKFTETSQRNLYEFMRRLLVKRFESSFGAFYESIKRFATLHETVLTFIRNSGGHYVLERKLIEKMYEGDEDEILKALEEFDARLKADGDRGEHEKVYDTNKFKDKDGFLKHIQSDLDLFKRIKEMLDTFNLVKHDPKRDRLVKELRHILKTKETPRRKVVIFSEYMDTVSHLAPVLKEAFDGRVLEVAAGGLTQGALKKIYANFDASAPEDKQEDEYQVLIASDKLSEGFNLNRAGAVINYDIPWNPTRVIQRVGRINRIGKKVFNELFIYNFFPTDQGADIVHSREIAAQKMFLIHNILGEDAKIFDVDEEPSAADLFKRINRNPDQTEEESLLTDVRNRLDDIKAKNPAVMERVAKLPARIKTAKQSGQNQLVVLQQKALGLFVQVVADTQAEKPTPEERTFADMLPLVKCAADEPRLALSDKFWQAYESVKVYRPVHKQPHTEKAVDEQALISLNRLVDNFSEGLGDLLPFVRTLIRDIRDYYTLPKRTLRTLAKCKGDGQGNLQAAKDTIEELKRLLGTNYLDVITKVSSNYRNKVIIAVENVRK